MRLLTQDEIETIISFMEKEPSEDLVQEWSSPEAYERYKQRIINKLSDLEDDAPRHELEFKKAS